MAGSAWRVIRLRALSRRLRVEAERTVDRDRGAASGGEGSEAEAAARTDGSDVRLGSRARGPGGLGKAVLGGDRTWLGYPHAGDLHRHPHSLDPVELLEDLLAQLLFASPAVGNAPRAGFPASRYCAPGDPRR